MSSMKTLHIQKGFDVNIQGKPASTVDTPASLSHLAVLPERIPFIKPRLRVKEGEKVRIGSVLYEDKRNPDVKFLSPGGGVVEEIKFGRRRVIQEIIVRLDAKESYETFETFSPEVLNRVDRSQLVKAILAGGLWCLFKALPFGDMPQPSHSPPAVIVNLDSTEPFQPEVGIYLEGKSAEFEFGMKLLERFTDRVFLSTCRTGPLTSNRLNQRLTHRLTGPYPAGDPGVLLYHFKKGPKDNRSWTINGQDLILLASLLMNGRYPTERTVAVGGSLAEKPGHLSARLGTQISALIPAVAKNGQKVRYIAGGVFRGYQTRPDSFLGLRETSLLAVPEADRKEFFGFARPGYEKQSYSRTFLSHFRKVPFDIDCSLHGEERACINCGYCAEVCAVDILPQFLLKTILAEEVEEALAHGMLDCVSCGLCTYVCPSKINIRDRIEKAKTEYYHEIYS